MNTAEQNYHEVYIDGVKYIPAKEVNTANRLASAKVLLATFWGELDDAKAAELLADGDIFVDVNDFGKGVPISEILDAIVEQS